MLCLSILWNSVFDFKKEIIEDISIQAKIQDVVDLYLGSQYESFVRTIYAQDKIPTSRIDKKLEAMFAYLGKTSVTIILFETDDDTMFYKSSKGRYLCASTENLKCSIREKYSKLIPLYVYDNVIHMTHDEEETEKDIIVVNEYINKLMEKPKRLIKKK
ncbi:MAG: hypothetical protein PHD05_04495 [Sphaerochaetaceae bacterium]|nr:hypothetical protein [Sphaerochaetaceae bacterium]